MKKDKQRLPEPTDTFKVNAVVLPGVQNYWGEHTAKHKLQMATLLNNLLLCQNMLIVQ